MKIIRFAVQISLAIILMHVPNLAIAAGKVVLNLPGEPQTLDPHLATGVLESQVINQLFEGLTLMNAKGQAEPGMAARWETSDDGTSYTFFLRDAKWSNGDPVTASDFVYGWRRCLAPETAAEYAYQLYLIRGAEDYNLGRNKDPKSVNVVAENDKVLTVHLKNPTPYFASLMSHYAYFPLKESWVSAHPDWSSNPENYLVNGPFRLAEWRHRDRIILKPNSSWYDAPKVKLDEIEMTMIANESTALLQWETGKIDIVTEVALPDVPRLKKTGNLQVVPYLGTYYVALNGAQKPFNDARVRKAFAMAIDRAQITRAILRGNQPEARAIVPPGIEMGSSGDFRKTGGDLFQENLAEAKKLLAEAGYPNGRGLPPIKYLYNDLELHRTIGEALQRMWLQNLGAKVTLQVQEYKTYIQTLHAKNFQMARAGWIADFSDPAAFLDIFQSDVGNNSFNYKNADFDKLLKNCRQTTDTAKRLTLLRQAEHKVITQDMVVIPVYFYVNQFLQKSRVKGIVRNACGGMDFRGCYVE